MMNFWYWHATASGIAQLLKEWWDLSDWSIAEGQELDFICENFMNYCLADVNNMLGIGTDNMTIMIIGFLNGRTKKEWYELIRTRVLSGDGPAATVEEVKPKFVEKEDTLIDENDRLNLVDEVKAQPTPISLQQLLGIDASIRRCREWNYGHSQ